MVSWVESNGPADGRAGWAESDGPAVESGGPAIRVVCCGSICGSDLISLYPGPRFAMDLKGRVGSIAHS